MLSIQAARGLPRLRAPGIVPRQKIVTKSLVPSPSKRGHILRSVIIVIHCSYLFVSLVYLRTYGHLSHTVLSCVVSCECEHYVRISEQDV